MDSQENNDPMSNIIDISDDYDDDEEVTEDKDTKTPIRSQPHSEKKLIGFIISQIVGIGQYDAMTGSEMVLLLRDEQIPDNPNAIKVCNTRVSMVGYIENVISSVLSPLIDDHLITIIGTVPNYRPGIFNHYLDTPVHVYIYSPQDCLRTVELAISRGELHTRLVYEGDDGMVDFSRAVMAFWRYKNGMIPDMMNVLFDMEMTKVSMKGMEKLKPRNDIIKSKLLPHQEEGLGWLIERETSNELPPFWVENNGVYVNVLIDYQTSVRPNPLRGGILADDMGLGKTLTLLSLIAFDKPTRNESLTKTTTLIVCPPSVIFGWVTQLEEHTKPGSMTSYVYYGSRTGDPKELEKYDVVLTTYATLASEDSRKVSPLKLINWWRVVLDEAHVIKNIKSKQSRAVNNLRARMRWAVTGTPIQNGFLDLFAFMTFLRFEPFSIDFFWKKLIKKPFCRYGVFGIPRLQSLIGIISLRRTKEGSLLGLLPEKSIEICYVDLSQEERALYDKLFAEARCIVSKHYTENRPYRNCTTVLSVMLRLRQVCIDTALFPADLKLLLPTRDNEDVKMKPELLRKMVELLQDGEDIDCAICIFPITNMVITICGHLFCRGCIVKALNRKCVCPLCRHTITVSDLFTAPRNTTATVAPCSNMSSKVYQLLKLLSQSRDENPSTKSVIFSQFRKMLVRIEEPLKAAGFKFLRLDGSMNPRKRDDVTKEFDMSGEVTVMLASMKTSGAGINLTSASRVYLLEPWWNPGAELQAMDRVHRIGQKEKVKIVRLIARDTIEQRVLELQEMKMTEARGLLDLNNQMDGGRIKFDSIRALLSLE